ncbi:MAG TPA: phosphatase PAP2 family protein, partial [Pirellula sp.]|nr:phosphatase PAP2 family protein [Pirellula sp.]
IGLSETFGHSSGGIVIFATLLWIDVKSRPKLWRAALFTLICGIAANAAKLFIPRYRPYAVEQSEFDIASSWQTWGTPWTGSWFEEEFRSFPSGHSATAVALAIGLTQVYPRGKWIFASLAATACLQRLESNAHFLSDIMGGIIIALVISLWYWKGPSSSESGDHCNFQNSIDHPISLTNE